MNTQYFFSDCAEILRQNGYAPAPLDDGNHPKGPFRMVQLPYPTHENADCGTALLCTVPEPQSERDAVQNPRAIGLACVTIKADAGLALKMERHIVEHVGKAPVRVDADGAKTYLFRYEDEPFKSMHEGDGKLSIVSTEFVVLGAPDDWQGGRDPVNTPRGELPLMLAAEAAELFNTLREMIPPPPPTERDLEQARVSAMFHETLTAGQSFRYGHLRAQYMLKEGGYLPAAVDWAHRADAQARPDAFWNDPAYRESGLAVMATPWRETAFHAARNKPLVTLTLKKIENPLLRQAVDELIDRHFPDAPLRRSSDGSTLRILRRADDTMGIKPVEFMRTVWDSNGQWVQRSAVTLHIREPGAIVIRGLDESGKEFEWINGRDPLVTPVDELPPYDYTSGLLVTQELERLLRDGELGDRLAGKAA